jgi:hypothetical protein
MSGCISVFCGTEHVEALKRGVAAPKHGLSRALGEWGCPLNHWPCLDALRRVRDSWPVGAQGRRM